MSDQQPDSQVPPPSVPRALPVPPPVVALAAAVAQRAMTQDPAPSRGRRLAATAVAVAAGSMSGTALAGFRKSGTTVDPHHPEQASALVTGGPYRVTRNPMYVGLTGVLLSHAVARRSVTALLPVAAFVMVIDRLQIPAEEAALRQRFGAEYDEFCRQVPRWIGPARA